MVNSIKATPLRSVREPLQHLAGRAVQADSIFDEESGYEARSSSVIRLHVLRATEGGSVTFVVAHGNSTINIWQDKGMHISFECNAAFSDISCLVLLKILFICPH